MGHAWPNNPSLSTDLSVTITSCQLANKEQKLDTISSAALSRLSEGCPRPLRDSNSQS